MKRHQTSTLELALLLVLMLPLQGLATAVSCAAFETASAPEHHCPHGTAVQHHGCGTCCSAAIAVTSLQWWTPPPSRRPPASFRLLFSPPKLALDRLDRPPRPTA